MSLRVATKLECPDCLHLWDQHGERVGGCGRCDCVLQRPPITVAERLAILRAQNPDPLVSHVDDKRNIVIGHVVTERRNGDNQRVGIVVERWHDPETGEPGVTTVDFIHRGKETEVKVRRFMVDELRQELLPNPDPWTCALNARLLHKVLGQRIKRNGTAEPLNDFERTLSLWADALDRAGQ